MKGSQPRAAPIRVGGAHRPRMKPHPRRARSSGQRLSGHNFLRLRRASLGGHLRLAVGACVADQSGSCDCEPGRYTILDYAKNVQDFRAANGRGQPLRWEQTDKQTWRVAKPANDDVTVRYQVFSTLLTDQMADLDGPSTFMYVLGQKHVPYTVKYKVPGGWKVYTGLEKRGDRYHAADYDIFIDAPALIGEFSRGRRCCTAKWTRSSARDASPPRSTARASW